MGAASSFEVCPGPAGSSVAAHRVIPIKVAPVAGAAAAEDAQRRLEAEGFLRMMALAEPRLSEFVAKYEELGYEVRLLPYTDGDIGGGIGSGAATTSVPDCTTIYVRKRKSLSPS
jgi:fructose-1,6-bisphosphatase/sedoheptulose 1,7-bisphosphatase-like protein